MNRRITVFHQMPLLIRLSILWHGLLLLGLLLAPQHWRWLLALLIANHLLITVTGLWPRSQWLGANWVRLPMAAAKRREIALTIDDGPDPLVTPQVLTLLDQFHVKATFFCIGDQAILHSALCRDIIRRGHCIENHSQRHRHYFSLLGLRGFARELATAQASLLQITGKEPRFFRAPAGLRNPLLNPVLQRLNLQLVSWTVRGFDTVVNDADKVKNKLLAKLQPGAILLLHDGNAARTVTGVPVIVAVLPALLDEARQLGLHFVTLADAAR